MVPTPASMPDSLASLRDAVEEALQAVYREADRMDEPDPGYLRNDVPHQHIDRCRRLLVEAVQDVTVNLGDMRLIRAMQVLEEVRYHLAHLETLYV